MKRIRIGKDISVEWTILTNGEATDLDLSRLSLVLISPDGIRTTMSDVTCSANKLTFHVGHVLQTAEGVYRLELWQDLDSTTQTVVDKLKAFQLVTYTQMEGGDDDDNINTDTDVDLGTSDLQIGLSDGIPEAPADGNIYGRQNYDWTIVEKKKADEASYVTYVNTTFDETTNTFSCSASDVTALKNGLCLAVNLCHDMTSQAKLCINDLESLSFRALPNNSSFYSRYKSGTVIVVTCSLVTENNSKGWWICDYSEPTKDISENDENAYGTFVNAHPGGTLIAYNNDGNLTSLYQTSNGVYTRTHNKSLVDYTVNGSKISTDSHIYFLSAQYVEGASANITLIRTYSMNKPQVAASWNVPLEDETATESTLVVSDFTPGSYVYMVGKISNGEFMLNDLDFVTSLPTSFDGNYYWQIGKYSSSSSFMLMEDQPIYYYDKGIKNYREEHSFRTEAESSENTYTINKTNYSHDTIIQITADSTINIEEAINSEVVFFVRPSKTVTLSGTYTINGSIDNSLQQCIAILYGHVIVSTFYID